MNKLDNLLKQALENQNKINETIKFIKEHEDEINEEQEDKLGEITHKYKEELLPEIERLKKNNSKTKK